MPKRAVDVYWHGSRVGSADNAFLNVSGSFFPIASVRLDDAFTAFDVRDMPLAFDPDFAELRGITGVELE